MGKALPHIADGLRGFIERQLLFFVPLTGNAPR
jgi:hypothetical protein